MAVALACVPDGHTTHRCTLVPLDAAAAMSEEVPLGLAPLQMHWLLVPSVAGLQLCRSASPSAKS